MKHLLLSSLILVFINTIASANDERCFKAINPSHISIKTVDEKPEITESAVSASVKMISNESLELKATSASLLFETFAILDPSNPTNQSKFYVECDGGSLTAKFVNDILVLNSKYLAGEIKTTSGCASGKVSFSDLAFEEIYCSK